MQMPRPKANGGIIMNKHLKKTVLAALFAALTYVATTFIRIPAPLGYINLGDCFVVLGAFLLGPVYGTLAGGIGSMLSDLFGYPLFAPATLVIKALMAVAAALIFAKAEKLDEKKGTVLRIAAAVIAEIIMIAGYFIFECFVYSIPAAAAEIPANLIQGAAAIISSMLIYAVIRKSHIKL